MASYRSLAPSLERTPHSSSSSTSKTGVGSSVDISTRNTSREATGHNDSGSAGDDADKSGAGGGGGPEEPLRKRRAPGTVSGRACNECRQARQKCDGEKVPLSQMQPPCSRCEQRNLKCVIEENIKTQKESLIERLRTAETYNEELQSNVTNLDSMVRDLNESNDWRGDILRTIGSNGHDSEIIQRLREGQSHQQIAEWLHQEIPEFKGLAVSSGGPRSLSEVVRMFEADCQDINGYPPLDGLMLSNQPWTDVSSDSRVVSRLLDLYFAYVHPVHLLFSEWDFKRCFQINGSIHCSRPLVNSMCAMACYLYENKPVGDGRFVDLQTTVETATLRKGFLDEARRTLQASNYRLLTSVQSFAIMYLIELSSGKASTALGYLDAAIDGLGGINESPQSHESKELTYWGLRNLKIFCAGSTYRTMTFPYPERQPEFKGINLNGDDEMWRRYYRPGYHVVPRRPTFSVLTAFHQAKLFRIIEDNLRLYCGRPRTVTADAACNQFRRYLAWQQQLTPRLNAITNVGEDGGPLPHIIYLHIQYHTAIVQHLMPILQSGAFRDENLHLLQGLVVSHSWKGLELLQLSQQIYTTRFCLPLISYCTVYLGDALLANSSHLHNSPPEKGTPRVLKICLELLQQTRAGFPVCGPLQKQFYERAIEYGVPIPEDMGEVLGSFAHLDVDNILDAFTRLSYAQPIERILSQIHPAIADEWPAAWRRSLTERVVRISSLLNSD